MKKINYFSYMLFIFFLFVVLSISNIKTQRIRSCLVASISPAWSGVKNLGQVATGKLNNNSDDTLLKKIELENALLKDQMDSVYKWLMFDQRIDSQLEALKSVSEEKVDELYWKDFFTRRADELRKIIEVELQALPAKIVFREPSSWSSSVWVNVGQKDNDELGRLIIAKNSPVVLGDSLIGIVEYVGKKQSRVRLITDSGLVPSVRAIRGSIQDRELLQVAVEFLERVYSRKDLFEEEAESEKAIDAIISIIQKLKQKKTDYYLAKGELHGHSSPLWRSYSQKIKGIGFNYDYADEEGPSRELKTGRSISPKYDFLSQSLLKEGDLLVTTGLDGIFPAGLKVAHVVKVHDIKEGDFSYGIEVNSTAVGLQNLNIVFIMPPLNFEETDF